MKIEIYANSHKGFIRWRNEDAIFVNQEFIRDEERFFVIEDIHEKVFMISVLDGIGGHRAGDVASELAGKVIAEKTTHLPKGMSIPQLEEQVKKIMKETNEILLQKGKENPEYENMGTTFTGVLNYYGEFFYVHVGDTRLYRIRDGNLLLITEDHTLRNLTKNDFIPSNILANSLGTKNEIYFEMNQLSRRIFNDDVFLLCSDGFWEYLPEDFDFRLDMQALGKELMKQILPLSSDNVSCVFFRIKGVDNE
ncbi:MAG: serine/threonine-protein phosphatase [Leptospiraceae bacterium]|nr:serine/threonine-protein phosphatase [Leptospiraceae bacterium]MDW7975105.1 serine/threonine-protein phosphatase [Leptospiraceae bacterium]